MVIAEIIALADFIAKQFGMTESEAKAAAEAAYAEVERFRKMGSPTALTDAALAEPPPDGGQ